MNVLEQIIENRYAIYNGDSCEIVKAIPDNSIHYTIFSPPFASLYTYSNSDRDMGNSKGDDEFYDHFIFLAKELYRVTMPGRLLSFHCMDLPLMKERDGVIGLKDFPAIIRKIFEDCGFIYHSKVTIWKNPVTEMQRTKALGLLHKQIRKDSTMNRQEFQIILLQCVSREKTQNVYHIHMRRSQLMYGRIMQVQCGWISGRVIHCRKNPREKTKTRDIFARCSSK